MSRFHLLIPAPIPASIPVRGLCLAMAACDAGPAERAGRSLDRAADSVRDAVDPPDGPGERLGRVVDRATR